MIGSIKMNMNYIISILIAFNVIFFNLNTVSSEEYLTQEQLEEEVVIREKKKLDINLDNQYRIEDAIYILQLLSGSKNDETWTNDLGMTFVLIKPGNFVMGSPEGETGRSSDEIQHTVTLTQAFYLQTTEVTQGQWKAVMGNNPSHFSNCGEDCPVENISWDEAQIFIEKLNLQEDSNRYRLPSEAQWEYAARAGSTTALANGDVTETECDIDTNMHEMGWYCGNADNKTHQVAQKQANAWGLYDMHGNVWEFCNDWYDSYPMNSVTDPKGASLGSLRVRRGGCWINYPWRCRSANRGTKNTTDRSNVIGIRLLRTVEN